MHEQGGGVGHGRHTEQAPIAKPGAGINSAQWYIGEIMGEANQQLAIPPLVTAEALDRSLAVNGELGVQALEKFFSRVVVRESDDCLPLRARTSQVDFAGAPLSS